MIKTMYFDLGNVLVFFDHEKMYEQLSTLSGLSVANIRSMLQENKTQHRYETGLITTDELYNRFTQASPNPFSLEEFAYAASNIFTPNEEIFPIIKEMKKQKIRLILLSNTSECHFNYIFKTYPILSEFNEWVLSYKAGACKPDPKIFEKALKLAECPASNCFFVDDIHEYVQAARKAGLDSEVFSNTTILKKHLADRQVFL